MFTKLLMFVSLLFSSSVTAGFIQIVRNTTVTQVDDKFSIQMELVNKGNENSREVSIEFPILNRKVSVSNNLFPNTPSTVQVDFIKKDINAILPGLYTLTFKILYQDNNGYSFTSPQVLSIVNGEQPITPAVIDMLGNNDFEISSISDIKFKIRNIQNTDLRLTNLQVFSASEFLVNHKFQKTPVTIGGNSEKMFKVGIENKSGLTGSNYQFFIIAEGEYLGKHFSVYSPFFLKLVESQFNAENILKYSFYLLGLILLCFGLFKTIKKKA